MHSGRIQLFPSMVVIILSPSQALAGLEWGLQNIQTKLSSHILTNNKAWHLAFGTDMSS